MPSSPNKPRPPAHLGPGGSRLWRSISDAYELRPDEHQILADCARERDLIDGLEDAQRDAPMLVQGSRPGQQVISPMVSELRMHRSVLASLLRALSIPDDDERVARVMSARSQQATKAARARWDRVG